MKHTPTRPPLSVVLPSHNDGGAIPHAVRAIQNYCPTGTEIIIVIDGSTDNSEEIVKKLRRRYRKLRFVRHRICMGKGASVRDGIMTAQGKVVAFTDVDLVIHPSHLQEAYSMMQSDKTLDIVIGRRIKYHAHLLRKILHVLFRLANIILFRFPFWDTQAGLKMFRAPQAKRLFSTLETKRYAFDVEILFKARAAGMHIGQISVIQNYRRFSSMNPGNMVRMAIDILGVFYKGVRAGWSGQSRMRWPASSMTLRTTGNA